MIFHYVLTCISLMANDFGEMVSVLICHLYIFFGEISLPVFCWFSNGIVYLFVLRLKSLCCSFKVNMIFLSCCFKICLCLSFLAGWS